MFFIQRWREDTPLGHRVVALPGVTVLDWFRAGWAEASPSDWVDEQLDGGPSGLESIFEEAAEGDLPPPSSMEELRALLIEHLWVESDDDPRVDAHTVRVRTDDDETDLAYYFVDDSAADAEEWTFLRHDSWPLPADTGTVDRDEPLPAETSTAAFDHDMPMRVAARLGDGPDAVFSVRISYQHEGDGTSLDLNGAVAFPGVTLPGLGAALTAVSDDAAAGWPFDALLLRALAEPGEEDIGVALSRFANLDGYDPVPWRYREEIAARLTNTPAAEQHKKTLVQRDRHIVQVARYIDDFWGFDQWFLFDSRWAAAHPKLARSLLRLAAHWDPLARLP